MVHIPGFLTDELATSRLTIRATNAQLRRRSLFRQANTSH